nr:hypothetical protein BaRGS_000035 [Batillaria attramentaria]
MMSYIRRQGGTKSAPLGELTRDLLLWCKADSIDLSARHISGRLNVIADSLSWRGQIRHMEWSLSPSAFKSFCQRWDRPHVDLFATRWNCKLPLFVSLVPDPQALAVDALSIPWDSLFAFAYPPAVLIPKIPQKLQGTSAVLLLVAPLRWEKSWVTPLLNLAAGPPLHLHPHLHLLRQPRSQVFHPCPETLNLHA